MTADNPYFVAELESGYAVLGWNQMYAGYTLFLSKTCVPELHELPPHARTTFLEEMAVVAEAVFRAFAPRKLNYELLGNSVSHLHWHLFPRYPGDPNPAWPVWSDPAFQQAPGRTAIEPERLAAMRERLRRALAELR
jgi:diadenosine tetraphosphate (Ap4A) HIT family hydrolase